MLGQHNGSGERNYGGGNAQAASEGNRSGTAGPNQYGARDPNGSRRDNRGTQNALGANAASGGQSSNYADGGDAGGTAGTTSGGSPGGNSADAGGSSFSSGAPDTSIRKDQPKLNTESLANRRGKDWGLRYAAPTATPVTRPLRVVCYSDRILILTDDARRSPKQIALKPQTRDSADDFVTAVWDEVKSWGIAGKGMYWRPILSFDVHAGADARYEDFTKLLEGSGFEVRRRATDVARQQPLGTPARPPR
jgi:hypothetical protein